MQLFTRPSPAISSDLRRAAVAPASVRNLCTCIRRSARIGSLIELKTSGGSCPSSFAASLSSRVRVGSCRVPPCSSPHAMDRLFGGVAYRVLASLPFAHVIEEVLILQTRQDVDVLQSPGDPKGKAGRKAPLASALPYAPLRILTRACCESSRRQCQGPALRKGSTRLGSRKV